MDYWEEKLNIPKPITCNRKAYCCQVATSYEPWNKIIRAKNSSNLKDFFNIFIPYSNSDEVKQQFPEAYESCLDIARLRENINLGHLYFYYCRFLKKPNICQIYEDRPSLCRSYPESPFDTIPSTCGFYQWSCDCKKQYLNLKLELEQLKLNQFAGYRFYLLSPVCSWIY